MCRKSTSSRSEPSTTETNHTPILSNDVYPPPKPAAAIPSPTKPASAARPRIAFWGPVNSRLVLRRMLLVEFPPFLASFLYTLPGIIESANQYGCG